MKAALWLAVGLGWSVQSFAQDSDEWGFEEDFEVEREPVRIFVSEFQSESTETASLAAMMRDFLVEAVDREPLLMSLDVAEAPDLLGMSALRYLETCPAGQGVGCAYVVADQLQARLALAGVIRVPEGEEGETGRIVDLTVIDVEDGREAFALQVDLNLGGDDRLASGVIRLLLAIGTGEVGGLEDIRHAPGEASEAPSLDRDEVAAELEQLQQELGGMVTLAPRSSGEIPRPRYTEEQLGEEMLSDAAKPWEMMDMRPDEFVRFRNSGLTLHAWKQASLGRKNQLMLRPVLGYARGPLSTRYSGVYALGPAPGFSLQERYAWQGLESANGVVAGGWVGWGLAPALELDIGVGITTGRFYLDVQKQESGENPENRDGEEQEQISLWTGARVFAFLQAMRPTHPVLGVGVIWRMGHSHTEYWEIPIGDESMPELGPSHLFEVQVIPGYEISLGDLVDLSVHLPIGFGFAGNPLEVYSEDGGLIEQDAPPGAVTISGGLELAVTLSLFGPTVSAEDVYFEGIGDDSDDLDDLDDLD